MKYRFDSAAGVFIVNSIRYTIRPYPFNRKCNTWITILKWIKMWLVVSLQTKYSKSLNEIILDLYIL